MSEPSSSGDPEFESLMTEWRRQQRLNTMAIAPWAAGLLGGVLWLFSGALGLLAVPVALGFGVVALINIRRRGERGAVLAWTGMVFAVVVAAAMTLVTRHLVQQAEAHAPPPALDLAAHDCFDALNIDFTAVDRLSCNEIHSGEVFEVVAMPGGPWPGNIVDTAAARCNADAGKAFPALASQGRLHPRAVTPYDSDWNRGTRRFVCYLFFAPGVDRPATALS